MKKRHLVRKSESGQAIVLLTFGIITLLAFFALAVDGGMYYSERRDAQGTADSAALTAALAICAGEDPVAAAEFIALQNGYDNNGTTNTVTVYDPPANGVYAGQNDYVEVVINTNIKGAITSLVGDDILESTVRSIAHCGTVGSSSSNYTASQIKDAGIVMMNTSNSSVLTMNGSGQIDVQSGSIFINSSHANAAMVNSNAKVNVGKMSVVGGVKVNGGGYISTTPITGVQPLDPASIFPNLVPPEKPAGSCPNISLNSGQSITLDPGCYSHINANSGAHITLNPGVYYVDAGNLNLNGSSTMDASSGVFLYFSPSAGSLNMNADTQLNIVPMSTGPYAGLAYWQDNSGYFNLNSNVELTSLSGTFYMPKVHVQLNSESDLILQAQIIADTVTVNSAARITINFGDAILYEEEESATIISLAE